MAAIPGENQNAGMESSGAQRSWDIPVIVTKPEG